MFPWKTYRDGPFPVRNARVNDPEYEQAMRVMVIVCADVVLCAPEERAIYLAERVIKPADGWWWIGGRVFPGEELQDAAARKLRQEAGLIVGTDRLSFVLQHRLMSSVREQAPSDAGSDSLSFLFRLDITFAESMLIHSSLSCAEFRPNSLRKFTRDQLVGKHVRPQILDAFDRIYGP